MHRSAALRGRPRPRPDPRPGQRGIALLGALALAAAALLLLGALALAGAFAWYSRDLPPLDKATDYRPLQHLQVLTAEGVEIAQFGTERRLFVPMAKMPKRMSGAVLAVEDDTFYSHAGFSWRGMARAVLTKLTGGRTEGASTITQQVARTFFLSTRRTAERKIKEALLSRQLESTLSKDQILELYLNQVYLGQRAYGVGAAAQIYFGKTLDQLSVAETAMIAGLPQNPIHANPVASPERAARRQRWVLQRMLKTGLITQAEHDAALTEQMVVRKPSFVDVHAEHVAEMARLAVVERLGDKAYTAGIRVVTSIRADDQRAAYAALRKAVIAHERKQPWRGPEDQEGLPDNAADAERAAALALKDAQDDEELRVAMVLTATPREVTAQLASGEVVSVRGDSLRWLQPAIAATAPKDLAIRRGSVVRLLQVPSARGKAPEWVLTQWPGANAALVALDPETGRVRALVGGFDFSRGQFNHVTKGERQPGSSFKPFLYSAAFEYGVMPETLVNDAPLTNADGTPPSWDPKNSDGKYDGEISVREGLVRSKNLVSIRLLQQIGLGPARDWIARFGFDMARQPDNLTLALGTGSVTPLQLATGYAVFANGGHRITPVLIERITDGQGKVLYEAPPPPPISEDNRVVPARNVFLVNSLLADVTRRGTAARAQATLQRPDLYGKTGTTNDAVDAWFGGFAPGAVAVAWMGYDDPQSLGEGESGGGLALPIWIDSMARMLRGVPVHPLADYLPPDGLVMVGGDWRYSEWADGGGLARVGSAAEAGGAAAGPAAIASAATR
jgi:penicillin-binding protein 1A